MHQYLFYIGDFPIRMYGLVLCMSIFLATGVAYFLAKQDGRWHQHVLDIGIYGGFAGLIGARLWGCVFFRLGLLPAPPAGNSLCMAGRHGRAGRHYCRRAYRHLVLQAP